MILCPIQKSAAGKSRWIRQQNEVRRQPSKPPRADGARPHGIGTNRTLAVVKLPRVQTHEAKPFPDMSQGDVG